MTYCCVIVLDNMWIHREEAAHLLAAPADQGPVEDAQDCDRRVWSGPKRTGFGFSSPRPFLPNCQNIEVFSLLCLHEWKADSTMTDFSCTYLMVAIYAYARLYCMFPWNFLAFKRQQYLDTFQLWQLCVRWHNLPLLATVMLHPLLVTLSREHEETIIRWKGLDRGGCSQYSLYVYESASYLKKNTFKIVTVLSELTNYGTHWVWYWWNQEERSLW